jgi:hypothetical protein
LRLVGAVTSHLKSARCLAATYHKTIRLHALLRRTLTLKELKDES